MGYWEAYSEHEMQTVRDYWQSKTDAQIADMLDCTRYRVTNCRHKLGLKKGQGKGAHPNAWSEQEDQIVRDHYADTDNEQILAMLPGRSLNALYDRAFHLGLKKSEAYMDKLQTSNGHRLQRDGSGNRFETGHEPFNKGMKQSDFMDAEAIEATKATRFKQGHTPANTKWDGAVSIRHAHEGRGEPPYMWIRISEGNWTLYHRHRWEQERGPIPDKHVLRCRNGNTLDTRPANWECISMGENARRNHNPQKSARSMKQYWQDHPHPARSLSDNYVAALLAGGDKELKEYIIGERPDIIRAARANYKLKRSINEQI